MSQYRHGVYVKEMATALVTPALAESALPVAVGCAPVHRLPPESVAPVNEPQLVYDMPKFEKLFGKPTEEDNPEDFQLWLMARAYFTRYRAAPVVFINVFDPAKHTKSNPAYTSPEVTPEIPETLPDVKAVQAKDIVGGTDEALHRTGLALVDEVFPRFRVVPAVVLAPGFGSDVTVAKAIETACTGISGHFRALGIIEVPDSVTKYTDAAAWLNDNNLNSQHGNTVAVYGDMLFDGCRESGAIHAAGCMAARDLENSGVPFWSPSNYQMAATGMTHAGELWHPTPAEAAYLNGQGILTGLNMIGGLRLWGDQTTAYPGVTDIKDASLPVRRMFNWAANTLVLTCWQFVSAPILRRQLETVQDTVNYWLNGLVGRGFLLGGRCDFEMADNPTSDLLAGKVRWHLYLGVGPAGGELEFILEYDPKYFDNIF